MPGLHPWEWVSRISRALDGFSFPSEGDHPRVEIPTGAVVGGSVYLHETVRLYPNCVIEGPTYIGAHTVVRPGAFIRGNVIVGQSCTLGHSCEYKNCLLMDRVETAHFNYVGDSVLGARAHLGAGVILANLKLKRDEVRAYVPGGRVPTGRNKLGAMLGDGAEIGCNTVLQPGTIVGRGALVMPGCAFGGFVPHGQRAAS